MKPIRTKKAAGWLATMLVTLLVAAGCQKAEQKSSQSGESTPSAKPAATVEKPEVLDEGPSLVPPAAPGA